MSTPSGKPFDPFDLSPYAPRRAREHSATERSATEGFAPVPAAGASDERINESESRDESSHAADPMPYPPRAALRAQVADARPADSQGGPPPAQSNERVGEPAAAPAAEVDLARLEASLQWLQREGAVARLPRAVPLPPVSGLRAVIPEVPRPRSEQFINGVRVPPSLAPERMRPPPMRERRDHLRGALRVLLAGAVAAPVAYYFSAGSSAPTSEPAPKSALAAFAARLVESNEFPAPKEKLRPGDAEAYNTVVSSRNKLVIASNNIPIQDASPSRVEMPAALPGPAPEPEPVAPAVVPAPPPAAPAAPAVQATRQLDPETIKLLMQQGEQFVAAGDLASARLVYLKAAEAGNAAAALALGATYDPVVLAKIGVRGMGADVDKARGWYEKAKAYGSPDAPRRLEMLANR